MNCRKPTNGLNTEQVKGLSEAWHHARRIGRPLNALATFRPLDINGMSEKTRCELFAGLRNKIGVYARQHRFPATLRGPAKSTPAAPANTCTCCSTSQAAGGCASRTYKA